MSADEPTSLIARLSEEQFLTMLLRLLETEEHRRVSVVRTLNLDILIYD